MCYGCFEEYGPAVVTPAAIAAAKLVDAVYEIHPVGGRAHVVVDDWNLDDSNIDFCLNEPELDEVCRTALLALKNLPMPERVAAMALHDKFITEDYVHDEDEIPKTSCALILHEDASIELRLPKRADDDEMTKQEVFIAACAILLEQDGFADEIIDRVFPQAPVN